MALSFDTNKLVELKEQFLEELQNQAKLVKSEDDYDELESIAEDIVCGIPTNIMQKDYYSRSVIRNYISDMDCVKGKNITEVLNELMKSLYDRDIIAMDYDYINSDIMDTLEDQQN